jgi:N,N-dimethylformamidase
MIPLTGYSDKLSVRPGETIRFHVASAAAAPVTQRLVRVISADPNPAGSGMVEEAVAAAVETVATPQPQTVPLGSYAVIPPYPALTAVRSFTAVVSAWAGGTGMPGCLMAFGDLAASGNRVVLSVAAGAHGPCFQATLGQGTAPAVVVATPTITAERWYSVILTLDAAAGTVTLQAVGLGATGPQQDPVVVAASPVPFTGDDIRIGGGIPGGSTGTPTGCFTGRIERPSLFDDVLRPADYDGPGSGQPAGLIGAWDTTREIHTERLIDVGPRGLHGHLVNQPTRAVAGSNWDGTEMCWRHAPKQYGAIHFHADDIDDCRWPVTHQWTVPEGTRSGIYALRLEAGDAAENLPFCVVPPAGKATAKIAVLVSTFTYTVYGNHARPEWFADPAWKAAWLTQAKTWGAYPHNPGDHTNLGLSTYNFHGDGSGIAYASWHRPMLNVRCGYLTYPYPDIRASGLRHFPADTHLTAWLEAKGHAYDIITDWELHHEGHELLSRYAVVLTGSHPEYHTRPMLDALTQYRDHGGRFCYLGGNGFYWKIALAPDRPGVIEIRRGEGGIRAWAADPGEYYHQFDGEYGGLWRRNGRPPQQLAGVGFTAQGNFVGSYYRRMPAASDHRVAWMFAGIDGDIIGDFGLSGHGAAGFELDRTDKKLGTPAHAIVVARSENHPPDAPWVLVPEEQLTHIVTWAGKPAAELIRADMTFFETAGGQGAVFSTGSITFCGSLPHNGFDNPVSTLLGNVVRRFLDATPFAGGGS